MTETLPARTVLWAAGVAASPLAKKLAEAAGCEVDRSGRLIVSPELTIPNRPEVFVIGDMAHPDAILRQPLAVVVDDHRQCRSAVCVRSDACGVIDAVLQDSDPGRPAAQPP